MPVTISEPSEGTDVKVNPQGEICANGKAKSLKAEAPIEVVAKIYSGSGPSPVPGSPPAGTTAANINGFAWDIPLIGTAAHAATPPHPTSTIVAWARYGANGTWESAKSTFGGISAQTTECAER
jgi:hypothetical protein